MGRQPTCRFRTQVLLARRLVERGVRFIPDLFGVNVRRWDAAHDDLVVA